MALANRPSLRMIAGLVRISAGRLELNWRAAIRHADCGAVPLSRPSGRNEAVAHSRLKTCSSGPGFSALVATRNRLWKRLTSRHSPTCPPATCPPGSAGDCRSRVLSPCHGRSGCLMSRPPPSTRPRRHAQPSSCAITWRVGGIDHRCRARSDRPGTRTRTEIGSGMSRIHRPSEP